MPDNLCKLLAVAGVLLIPTGCETGNVTRMYDLQTGTAARIPAASGSVIRIAPDSRHFSTILQTSDDLWRLRTWDMSGKMVSAVDVLAPDPEHAWDYTLDVADYESAVSADGATAFSMFRKNTAPLAGNADADTFKMVLLDMKTGKLRTVPVQFGDAVARERGLACVFPRYRDAAWVLCNDGCRNAMNHDGCESFVGLYRVTETGCATRVFRHAGAPWGGGGFFDISGDYSTLTYAYQPSKQDECFAIRVVATANPDSAVDILPRELNLRLVSSVALSRTGELLAVTGRDGKKGQYHLLVYDLKKRSLREVPLPWKKPSDSGQDALACDPAFIGDGQIGVFCVRFGFPSDGKKYFVIDLASGKVVHSLPIKGRLNLFFATPDGRYVIMQSH